MDSTFSDQCGRCESEEKNIYHRFGEDEVGRGYCKECLIEQLEEHKSMLEKELQKEDKERFFIPFEIKAWLSGHYPSIIKELNVLGENEEEETDDKKPIFFPKSFKECKMNAETFKEEFKYDCLGPDQVGGFSGMRAPKEGLPQKMTINSCMWNPDCACHNYREAIKQFDFLDDIERRQPC